MKIGVMSVGESVGYKALKEKVIPVLRIKVDEFHLLGYERVGTEDIWKCVTERIDKREDDEEEEVRLHDLVNEILTLSMNDYLNRLRMESLRGPDWFGIGEVPADIS